MSKNSRCAGQLYQLRVPRQLDVGAYVLIDGPWDTYGSVVAITEHNEKGYLHLIRGIPERKGHTPVASF